jgi:hypothetical protein
MELPQPRMSSSDNTTPPSPSNPFMKTSIHGRKTCGQITSYVTLHMSAQYCTHVFFILICGKYARLFQWDHSGTIFNHSIYYNKVPDLVDFFIYFNHLPAYVQGQDTSVRVANCKDTKDTVKVIKEFKELEKLQILCWSLLF